MELIVRLITGGIGAIIGISILIAMFSTPVSVAEENPSLISGFVIFFIIIAFILFIYACFRKREG